jgi:hypothetical protein
MPLYPAENMVRDFHEKMGFKFSVWFGSDGRVLPPTPATMLGEQRSIKPSTKPLQTRYKRRVVPGKWGVG